MAIEQLQNLGMIFSIWWVALLVSVWTIPWKGYALWRAGRNRQIVWFIVLLVVNTLAILEIVYIFAFQKDRNSAVKSANSKLKKR